MSPHTNDAVFVKDVIRRLLNCVAFMEEKILNSNRKLRKEICSSQESYKSVEFVVKRQAGFFNVFISNIVFTNFQKFGRNKINFHDNLVSNK